MKNNLNYIALILRMILIIMLHSDISLKSLDLVALLILGIDTYSFIKATSSLRTSRAMEITSLSMMS